MEQYYIVDIPFFSLVFFGLAVGVLFGLVIMLIYPSMDWKKKSSDFFEKFKKNKEHIPKKETKIITPVFWKKTARRFSRQNKNTTNPGQLLCDYLNTAKVQEILKAEPENMKVSILRSLVNEFLIFHQHIPNGDIRSTVIDLNWDRHYRIRLIENKWIIETEQTSS